MKMLLSSREYEEERRLFYVAITRAKEYCIISYSKERAVFTKDGIEKKERKRSPFIDNIDRAYIRMLGDNTTYIKSTPRPQAPAGVPTFALTNRMRGATPTPQEPPRRIVPQRLQRVTPSAAPASAASVGNNPLRVGQIIEHNRFGIGDVIEVEGSGVNAKATIKFRNVGVKKLILAYATYKIIE